MQTDPPSPWKSARILPEDAQQVFIHDGIHAATGYYSLLKETWVCQTNAGVAKQIKFWMPIPKLP